MDHKYRDASNSPSAWAPAPPEAWGPLGDAPLASSGHSRGDGGAPEAAGGLFGGLYDDAVARVCREPGAPVPAKPVLLPKDGPPDRSFMPGKHLPSGPAAPEDGLAKFAAENPVKAKLLETLGVSGALTVKAGMQEGADKRAVAERGAERVAAEKIARIDPR